MRYNCFVIAGLFLMISAFNSIERVSLSSVNLILPNAEQIGVSKVWINASELNASELNGDDSSLIKLSNKILRAFKAGNYKTVVSYVEPGRGVRFSPYGASDTLQDKTLTRTQILSLAKSGKKIRWGMYDGKGNPISLPISGYSKKFVYDRDFLKATKVSVNKSSSPQDNLEWLTNDYPDCSYVQYYFPGEERYNGMNWKTLILVFRESKGKTWLAGVVHDQWKA